MISVMGLGSSLSKRSSCSTHLLNKRWLEFMGMAMECLRAGLRVAHWAGRLGFDYEAFGDAFERWQEHSTGPRIILISRRCLGQPHGGRDP